MKLKDLAKAFKSKSIQVTIMSGDRVLWTGRSTDLRKWEGIFGWTVVEMLVDPYEDSTEAPYNKGRIITVI